jgi:hypothetical protein
MRKQFGLAGHSWIELPFAALKPWFQANMIS